MDENTEELRKITLRRNVFINEWTDCYYVLDYLRHGIPGNPEFLLTLKNTFNSENIYNLRVAKNKVKDILYRYTPYVMKDAGMSCCAMVCVPRAKAFTSYKRTQMYLLEAVSEAAGEIPNVTDATAAIVRTADTKTTHLSGSVMRVTAGGTRESNSGPEPYPGITKDTCIIDAKSVREKNVILVDDIYTPSVNIDEDCAQALYDAGAKKVVLFAISYTV